MKLALAAVLLLLVAGCGGTDKAADPGPTKTTSTAAASETPTAEPSDAGPPVLRKGQKFDNGLLAVEFTEYRSGFGLSGTAEPGNHWAGVLVKTCNEGLTETDLQQTVFSWDVFTLEDADSGQYPASTSTYNGFPAPEYPFGGKAVRVGACAKGWVVFEVPDGTKPRALVMGDDSAVLASWKFRA